MTALHTAYTYTVVAKGNGCVITLREKLKVVPDPDPVKKRSNPFAFLILDEEVENPREVVFNQAASAAVESVCSFMDSLTDDLIYNQWFRVKEHKKKKEKA